MIAFILNSLVFGELCYTDLVNRAGVLVLRCCINRGGLALAFPLCINCRMGKSLEDMFFANRTSTGSSREAWIIERDISHPEGHESSRDTLVI